MPPQPPPATPECPFDPQDSHEAELSAATPEAPLRPAANAALYELILHFGIEKWDMFLIGDGSGSKWDNPVGWASVAILRDTLTRKVFYGAANDGTVNLAEIMAYIAPLSWFGSRHKRWNHDVHIITDSQYVADTGRITSPVREYHHNQILWAGLASLSRFGLRLHWHWLPRETLTSNQSMDAVSRASRVLFTGCPVLAEAQRITGIDPLLSNPD